MELIDVIRYAYLAFGAVMVVLTAVIAAKRHRAFVGYALLAAVFPIPALLIVLALGDKEESEILRTQGKGLWFAILIGGTILFTRLLYWPFDRFVGVIIDHFFPQWEEAPYEVNVTIVIICLALLVVIAFLLAMVVADLVQATLFIHLEKMNQHRRDTEEERAERNARIARGVFCAALGMFLIGNYQKKKNIKAYNESHPDNPI